VQYPGYAVGIPAFYSVYVSCQISDLLVIPTKLLSVFRRLIAGSAFENCAQLTAPFHALSLSSLAVI
jgi:hypothetical protein